MVCVSTVESLIDQLKTLDFSEIGKNTPKDTAQGRLNVEEYAISYYTYVEI